MRESTVTRCEKQLEGCTTLLYNFMNFRTATDKSMKKADKNKLQYPHRNNKIYKSYLGLLGNLVVEIATESLVGKWNSKVLMQ